MKNIFTLIVSLGIILFTLISATVGHTNPDSVGAIPLTNDILRSKTAFAVVEEEIAHHLNLSLLSEWDYQKLRGRVLWKIRAPIHFHLREQFGRIVDTVDFSASAGSGSPSQTPPMSRGEKPILHKRAAEIIRDFIAQEQISVIIRSNAPIGMGQTAPIRGLQGEVRYTYELINGACVFVPIRNLAALIKRPFVTEIWPDSKGYLALADSVPQIGADKVHNPPPAGFGITGKGIRVAVVDGGIDSNHPDLRGRVVDTRGVPGGGGSNKGKDAVDHGTHVAGIIAANGPGLTGVAPEVELLDAQADWKQDSFIFGNFTYFQLNQDNYSDTMDAIRWAAKKNRILNSREKADVINLSAGWDFWEYGRDGGDPMSQLIDEVVDSGIVFVVAAGNEALRRATGDIISNLDPINTEEHKFKVDKLGIVKVTLLWDKAVHDLDLSVLEHPSGKMLYNSRTRTSVFNNSLSEQIVFTEKTGNVWYTLQVEAPFGRVQDSQNYEVWVSRGSKFEFPDSAKTVNVPAYSQKAITVGAVDRNDAASFFSSQGPSSPVAINPGLVLKPSLIKPEIVAPGGNIKSTISAGGYDWYPGTSMAAPHVAGIAALILDAVGKNDRGEWNFSPDEVKAAIVRGAERAGNIPNTPDNTYGAGLVRADNIIFSNTVPANGTLHFEIKPRLYDFNYGGYSLNADLYIKAAISWKNKDHNLDLVLSDASGKTLMASNRKTSNFEKIGGGNSQLLPSSEIAYFLEVFNRSQEPVAFTGAATHKIVQTSNLTVLKSVAANTNILTPEENFTLTATVKNQGTGKSPPATLRYYKWDEIAEEWKHIPGKTNPVAALSANATSTKDLTLTAPNTTGKHFYTVCVDAVPREGNLDTNCYESWVTITVQQPTQTPVFVYWADSGTGKIQRANLDGSNIQDIVTGLDDPYSIALDGTARKIYWTDYRRSKIQRANLDGSNMQDIVTRLGFPYGIALDVAAGKVYWTDEGPDKIQRANLDGSNIQDVFIVRGLGNPKSIALDVAAGKMYWTTAWTEKIQRANLNGTNLQDLVTPRLAGLGGPSDIALDVAAGKMYWTNPFNHKIQRANLNGTNIETLVSGGRPYGIALDVAAGKMYWTNWHTDKIQRANLDGSNVEDFVTTGLVSPTGIALGIPTPKVPDLLVTALSTSKSSLAPSENFTLSAIVENQGTGESSATTLRYYTWDAITEEWKQIPDKTNPVAVLSANATSAKDLTLIAPNTTGEHFYTVCVDAVPGEDNPDTNCFESWVTITVQQLVIAEDVNGDGVVDILDLVLVDSHFGETGENGADVNEDGIVNIADLLLVAKVIGNAAGAPSIQPVILNILTAEEVQQWLTAARKLPNWPAYQRGIVVLEQLLAMLIPKETALLPNYPNPFNPETWIPYHLAEAAEVSLAIYAVDGTVVRTLLLGHQAVGIYQDRKRAAYWDGRNTQGEPVASGVYFYTLKAGDFTTTRKMLIRK